METDVMSSRDYRASGGCLCPLCRSTDIESRGNVQSDGQDCWRRVYCNACGASWADDIVVIGYFDLMPARDSEV